MVDILVRFLGWEDPLEKGMASYSSILAQRISWPRVTGRLQSKGPQRVGHDLATNTFESIYDYLSDLEGNQIRHVVQVTLHLLGL